jgi:hypothetical protein
MLIPSANDATCASRAEVFRLEAGDSEGESLRRP